MKLSELGEDVFLQQLRSRFPDDARVSIGIGDDAAQVDTAPQSLLSVDALVEGTHFATDTTPPRYIGRKAVASSVSDIAAMGGNPSFVLLSLVVSRELDVQTLWQMVDGASERARELGMALVGGNVSATAGPIVVSVTAVGASVEGRALRRDGARSGQALFVSGEIGASRCGRLLLEKGAALSSDGGLVAPQGLRDGPLAHAETAIRAHIDPEPRLALGRALNEGELASACLDVSDGLAMDLKRLCRASGVGARLEEASLPLAPAALAWAQAWNEDPTEFALAGGEDYELLFAAPPSAVHAARSASDVAITRIGELVASREAFEIVRRDDRVEPLSALGWDHFDAE